MYFVSSSAWTTCMRLLKKFVRKNLEVNLQLELKFVLFSALVFYLSPWLPATWTLQRNNITVWTRLWHHMHTNVKWIKSTFKVRVLLSRKRDFRKVLLLQKTMQSKAPFTRDRYEVKPGRFRFGHNSFYSRYLHETKTKTAQASLKSSRLLDRADYVQSGMIVNSNRFHPGLNVIGSVSRRDDFRPVWAIFVSVSCKKSTCTKTIMTGTKSPRNDFVLVSCKHDANFDIQAGLTSSRSHANRV